MKKGYFLVPLLLVGVVGCGRGSTGNTDPHYGWVTIDDENEMKCVGTTMLFENTYDNAISTVPNDPRCK